MGASLSRESRSRAEQAATSTSFLRSFAPSPGRSVNHSNKVDEKEAKALQERESQSILNMSCGTGVEKKSVEQEIIVGGERIICNLNLPLHQRQYGYWPISHDQPGAPCSCIRTTRRTTSAACGFSREGQKGVANQDAFVIWENFASREETILCAVFDGHGPHGHLVARRIRDTLPLRLLATLKAHFASKKGRAVYAGAANGTADVENGAYGNINGGNDENEETENLGELISTRSSDSAPTAVSQDAETNMNVTDIYDDDDDGRPASYINFSTWRELMLNCCSLVDRDLKMHAGNVDCVCSGTTALFVLKQGEELIIGNVGDSRAVLATSAFDEQPPACIISDVILDPASTHTVSQLKAIQLTVDLKPSIPEEMERIQRCKGRVFVADDEPEVSRIWMPCNDSPGLAMSRAFGDFALKDFGLICDPEMTYRRLTTSDKFVILATDGIWDVLSNNQAIEVVSSTPSKANASKLLVDTAIRAWSTKYPFSKFDDCTAICLFFDTTMTSSQSKCLSSQANSIVIQEHKKLTSKLDRGDGFKDDVCISAKNNAVQNNRVMSTRKIDLKDI